MDRNMLDLYIAKLPMHVNAVKYNFSMMSLDRQNQLL